MPQDDDDYKARLRRAAQDIVRQEEASEAARQEQARKHRDFLVEFRETMTNVVEPALKVARDELDRAGLNAGVRHLTDDDDCVGLHLVSESKVVATLSYTVPTGTYGEVRADVVSEKQSSGSDVPLSRLSGAVVRRHVELLLEAAKNKPIDYLGAWDYN